MAQKIIRTGNSAAVTIPSEFMEALNLKVGDRAVTKMNYGRGEITYRFPQMRQLPLVGRKK